MFGHDYGLPALPPNRPCILLLRAPVVKQFMQTYPTSMIVEIDAPLDILKERLYRRSSQDRIDDISLQQEMKIGVSLAHATIDTSKGTDECIEELLELIRA